MFLVVYAATKWALKTLNLSVKITPLCGCPGIPGDFALSRCVLRTKSKMLTRIQFFQAPGILMRGARTRWGANASSEP